MLKFDEYKKLINDNLTSFIPTTHPYAETVRESMIYSLEVGGKRLRPVLLLAACDFAGGDINEALPYACALEYIHTYSLIHDDLPAMDNDDLRRGKPTNHKVYGEAMAILAGDGLLTTAAEIMTGEIVKSIGDNTKLISRAKASSCLISRSGINGMIGGQVADVENEYNEADSDLVNYIEEHKCGDLIAAPVIAGLYLADSDDETISIFSDYGMKIGTAFQVLDDILDFEGDAETIGKNVGKDKDLGKCNYACVHGLDAAKQRLHELTSEAKACISQYGESAEFFTKLADSLESRKA